MAQYAVHSWHINIGTGDSAIHLLVDEAGSKLHPRILKSVLIDGGENTTRAERAIAETIRRIRGKYDLTGQDYHPDDTTMRFDGIVVTHWDKDHYGGIRALLETDYAWQLENFLAVPLGQWEPQYEAAITSYANTHLMFDPHDIQQRFQFVEDNPALKAAWDTITPIGPNLLIKSRYMKYSAAYPANPVGFAAPNINTAINTLMAGQPIREQLLTTFYAPYVYGKHVDAGNILGKVEEDEGVGRSFFTANADNSAYAVANPPSNTLTINILKEYVAGVPTPGMKEDGKFVVDKETSVTEIAKFWRFIHVAKVLADYNHYLGAELFYNNAPRQNFDAYPTPLDLFALTDDGPRMFIVAGDQVVVGSTTRVGTPLVGSDEAQDESIAKDLSAFTSQTATPTVPSNSLSSSSSSTSASSSSTSSTSTSSSNDMHLLAAHPTKASAASTTTTINTPLSTTTMTTRSSTVVGDLSHIPTFRPKTVIRAINKADGITGSRFVGFRDTPTSRNSCSLVIIIITRTDPNTYRLMHYTAGDALFDTEQGVANWLSGDGTRKKMDATTSLMKVSHHGASNCMPWQLLETLNPRAIICSAYEQFCHPRPEILFMVHAWWRLRLQKSPDLPKPFFGTNYPSWIENAEIKNRFSVGVFEKIDSFARANYVNRLVLRYFQANMPRNPWTEWVRLRPDPASTEKSILRLAQMKQLALTTQLDVYSEIQGAKTGDADKLAILGVVRPSLDRATKDEMWIQYTRGGPVRQPDADNEPLIRLTSTISNPTLPSASPPAVSSAASSTATPLTRAPVAPFDTLGLGFDSSGFRRSSQTSTKRVRYTQEDDDWGEAWEDAEENEKKEKKEDPDWDDAFTQTVEDEKMDNMDREGDNKGQVEAGRRKRRNSRIKAKGGSSGSGAGTGAGIDSGDKEMKSEDKAKKMVLPTRPLIAKSGFSSTLSMVPENSPMKTTAGGASTTPTSSRLGGSVALNSTSRVLSASTSFTVSAGGTLSTTPAHNTAVIHAAAGPVAPGGPTPVPAFYVCGSVYQTFKVATNIAPLEPGKDLDPFISSLQEGFVTLVAGPNTSFATGLELSPNDPYMQALLSNSLGIQSLKMTGSVKDKFASFSSVTAEVKFGILDLKFSSDELSRFSLLPSAASAAATSATTITPAISTTPATTTTPTTSSTTSTIAKAYVPDYNILALGLVSDPTASSNVLTIPKLLTLFEIPWLTAAAGVLPGFGSKLSFTIDTSDTNSRCGLFLRPSLGYPSWLRLRYKISSTLGKSASDVVTDALPFLKQKDKELVIADAYMECLRYSKVDQTPDTCTARHESTITLQADFAIKKKTDNSTATDSPPLAFSTWLEFGVGQTKLVLNVLQDNNLQDMLDWLLDVFGFNEDIATYIPGLSSFKFHQIELTMDNPTAGSSFAFDNIAIKIEVDAFKSIFLISLNWPNTHLKGEIWNWTLDSTYSLGMIPWFQPYQNLVPFGVATGEGHLSAFLPGNNGTINPPAGMDLVIVEATFEAWKDPSSKALNLTFVGAIVGDPTKSHDIPTVKLQDISVTASYVAATASTAATWDVKFDTEIVMYPRNWTPTEFSGVPTQIDISVETEKGVNWWIKAAATDVDLVSLYQLFDSSSGGPVMDILSQINIPFFSIAYDYVNGGSHFALQGSLLVHTLELELTYNYYSNPKHWTFQASLGSVDTTPGTTNQIRIVDLIRDFDADSSLATILDDVPFIRDVALPSVHSTPQGFDDAPIQLFVGNTGDSVVMWFQVEIITPAGELSFLFVQHKTTTEPALKDNSADKSVVNATSTKAETRAEAPADVAATPATPPRVKPKRLLRVKLDKLPALPSIPVVGSIGQPIDSIDYLLVQDGGAAQTGAKSAGFTSAEMDDINGVLSSTNQIQYRSATSKRPASTKTPATTPVVKADDFVLLEGHHFIVVTEGKVVLDHLFGGELPTEPAATPSTSGTQTAGSGTESNGETSAPEPTPTPAPAPAEPSTERKVAKKDSGTTMGSNKKSFGPFTLNNLGLQVKDNHLYIILDATIALGEIQLSLVGFAIGIPLSLPAPRKLSFTKLSDLDVTDFDIKLSGLNVGFQSPSVTIVGFFEKQSTENFEAYRGGLQVSMLPYTLLAVGAYQHTIHPADFKSVFVFAKLDGPLFTLEFAEIKGVEAGFGYNYDLRLPGAADVLNFPLVHGAEASNNPMDLMSAGQPGSMPPATSFLNWTTPKQDSLWFAIGLKADAFQVLSADAAAIVALGSDSFKIAIVAIASASMPPNPDGGKPPSAFIYVELGIIAAIDINGGSMTCVAQLTPNSYILAPDCHLTGGFALCYWFGPSTNSGDWVFTVGGYHPAFKAPDYYPQVPRLGISWSMDPLTIRGEAYFAVCPKAAMGGGRLLATFDAGPIYASFEAWASFLVNFKPFYFIADIGVCVTVGFQCSIGLIHINIHADIGASLHLEGPPFHGTVYVDLWIHSFSVNFGPNAHAPPALRWVDFLPLVRQPGPAAQANAPLVVVAIEDGSVNEKTNSATRATGESWYVRAGTFKFRLESKFPIETMNYGDGIKQVDTSLTTSDIFSRPMQVPEKFTSRVVVRIMYTDGDHPASTADDTDNPWIVKPIIRGLPKALWNQYNSRDDPTSPDNDLTSMLSSSSAADSKIDHLVGFTFITPNPQLSPVNMPTFDAVAAMQEGVFADGFLPAGAPPGTPQIHDDRPILPPMPPAQTEDVPVEFGAGVTDPWQDVVDVWTSTAAAEGEEMGRLFVGKWSEAFGWSVQAPVTSSANTNTPAASSTAGGSGATLGTGTAPATAPATSPTVVHATIHTTAPSIAPATTTVGRGATKAFADTVPASGTTTDTARPVGNGVQPQPPLVPVKPHDIIGIGVGKQKNFETYYLGLPWLTSGIVVPAST